MTHHITDEQIDEATKDIGLQSPFARYRIARAVLALAAPQAAPMTEAELIAAQTHYISSRPMFADTKSFADGIRYAEAHHGITTPAGGEQPAAHQATKEPRK